MEHLKKHDDPLNPFKIPLIITSAAALETILNETIIVECRHRLPERHIKRITNSHLGMSLGGKLDNLGWLLTDNNYIMNNRSEIYQCLKSIIKYRNEIMHLKEYYKKIEFGIYENETDEGIEEGLILDEDFFNSVKSSIEKIPNDEYENMYRAISELEITIINITSKPPIEENDLFIQNT